MKKLQYFLLIGAVLFAIGCRTNDIDFTGMNARERTFNERQSKELVAYMSLETMFPDTQVRALAKAAGKGRVNQIDDLVNQGVSVNSRGAKNATPLFWAMRNGSVVGFQKLLELGADPNVVFDDGGSVIHWAVQHEDSSFLRLALEHDGNPNLVAGEKTPLFDTIGFKGDSDILVLKILLTYGADPNMKEARGNTPAMIAAGVGRFDIVYVLLNSNADYNLKNDAGYSLLDRVAAKRNAFIPGSEQEKSLEQVIDWLSRKGVTIPD